MDVKGRGLRIPLSAPYFIHVDLDFDQNQLSLYSHDLISDKFL